MTPTSTLSFLTALTLAAVSLAAPVVEHDIRPSVAGGAIAVEGVPHGGGPAVPAHVFGYEFGEFPEDPYFLEDPGFNALAGSGFPGGSTLRFDALRGLRYWNGTGPVGFAAPPNDEALRLEFGALQTTIDAADIARSGFVIGAFDSGGALHRHLNAFLLGGDGNPVPGDGVEATLGLYYTNLILSTNAPGVGRSRPLFLVYNNGLAEPAFEQALAFLDALLPGDADANGVIDFDDYVAIDNGFNNGLSGYANGDFDGSGTIDFDDYVLIDASFNQQNGVGRLNALPEPVLSAPFVMVVTALCGRTRRRPLQPRQWLGALNSTRPSLHRPRGFGGSRKSLTWQPNFRAHASIVSSVGVAFALVASCVAVLGFGPNSTDML